MRYEQEREQIINSCIRMCDDQLTLGTSGNVSIRIGDHIVITPSAVPYPELTPDMVPIIDLHGNVVEGALKPSSETPLHTFVLRGNAIASTVLR
ncbi:class II aldolase/adducin family protein [Stomatohabitans albus]|uniref:class II aldolase/adducin family protein n=1 Tax=Stomatohabitans albus TaxID=3110766 RepID=UPI00300C06FF